MTACLWTSSFRRFETSWYFNLQDKKFYLDRLKKIAHQILVHTFSEGIKNGTIVEIRATKVWACR